jgi:hypothetical protein
MRAGESPGCALVFLGDRRKRHRSTSSGRRNEQRLAKQPLELEGFALIACTDHSRNRSACGTVAKTESAEGEPHLLSSRLQRLLLAKAPVSLHAPASEDLLRTELVVRAAVDAKIGRVVRAAQSCGHRVVELEKRSSAATPPVFAFESATKSVTDEDLAPSGS